MEVEKNGVTVIINGNIQIEDITLNPELDHGQQARTVKDCINDAVKKMQYATAEKMQELGDFGDFGL